MKLIGKDALNEDYLDSSNHHVMVKNDHYVMIFLDYCFKKPDLYR